MVPTPDTLIIYKNEKLICGNDDIVCFLQSQFIKRSNHILENFCLFCEVNLFFTLIPHISWIFLHEENKKNKRVECKRWHILRKINVQYSWKTQIGYIWTSKSWRFIHISPNKLSMKPGCNLGVVAEVYKFWFDDISICRRMQRKILRKRFIVVLYFIFVTRKIMLLHFKIKNSGNTRVFPSQLFQFAVCLLKIIDYDVTLQFNDKYPI